jgi:hypothetical protein
MRQPFIAAQLLRQARTAADAEASERPALSPAGRRVRRLRMHEGLKVVVGQRSASVALVIRSRSARMIRHGYQTASRIRWVRPNQRWSGTSGVDANAPMARNSTP